MESSRRAGNSTRSQSAGRQILEYIKEKPYPRSVVVVDRMEKRKEEGRKGRREEGTKERKEERETLVGS